MTWETQRRSRACIASWKATYASASRMAPMRRAASTPMRRCARSTASLTIMSWCAIYALGNEEHGMTDKELADEYIPLVECLRQSADVFARDDGDDGEPMPAMAELLRTAAGEVECLRLIIGDIRVLYHSGRLRQFEGEPWLRRVLNIDLQR